ncbi:MAG: cyclic nucleotide-binding domain-containing protein, partial [Deltaproteobacteria bacterium]|nr:cyclic nucleotide-binding domain-containing protein [Deltaproteobacteria bacterium]
LIFTSEKLVLEERWNYADPLLDRLLKWVGETERSDEFLERAVILLERAMQHYWRSGEELHGDTIQKMFYRIRTGSLPKTAIAKAIAGHAQDRGIERSSLPDLLQKCFLEPHNDLLSCRLIFQGPVATRFLVETLIETQDTAHRYKIIDLLTSFGDPLVAEIVQERITEHMPWYGKCNLLKLLTAAGDKDDADAALPFLNHKDFRVQREAFLCLYKIGGRRRRELLLRALANSSELIKIQIINALVRFPDPEVGDHLAKWLTEYDSFSEKNRDALLMQLLDTLAGCPCPSAEKAVQDFLKNRGRRAGRKIPEPVWEEAEKTMNLLESNQKRAKKSHVQASQLRKDAIRQAVKRGKTAPGERIITGLAEEQAIRMLLGSGEEEKAREKLVQLIGQTTQTRNYVQAEKLREWLIDINETAIGDIIRTAEIISHRKVAAVDSTHLEIWKELYEYLTTEEFDALYQSLQQKKYENEEIVVHQGALQTALYFINSGTVKLFFRDKGNRVLIKTMGKGEIMGAGSFFDASVWTVSVASVGISDISLLRHEKMHQWKEEFPGLEQKLRDFCSNFETIEHILSQSAQDRRQHNRYTVSGQVTTLLLDNSGQATGVSSEVELCDISQSGVSYYLQIPRRENARLILGRKVKIILPSTGSGAQEGGVIGDILAVKMRPGLDSGYSIHVRFDTEISSLQLDEIVMIFDGKSTIL